jgi:hypothetical protein
MVSEREKKDGSKIGQIVLEWVGGVQETGYSVVPSARANPRGYIDKIPKSSRNEKRDRE